VTSRTKKYSLLNFGIENYENYSRISGTLVNNDLKLVNSKNYLSMIRFVIRSYLISPIRNQSFVLKVAGSKYPISTNKDGFFNLNLNHFLNIEEDVELEFSDFSIFPGDFFSYYHDFHKKKFFVVSDLDDTLIKSNTRRVFKRVFNTLLLHPEKRKPIPYTEILTKELAKLDAGFYYVSKSEENLYRILSSFIENRELPKGIFFLTRWLSLRQLLNPRKDKNHKIDRIKRVFKITQEKNFVLIGDDTQRDLEIYMEIAKDFPERILKILIRKTNITKDRISGWKDAIEESNVSFSYFTDEDDPLLELKDIQNRL